MLEGVVLPGRASPGGGEEVGLALPQGDLAAQGREGVHPLEALLDGRLHRRLALPVEAGVYHQRLALGADAREEALQLRQLDARALQVPGRAVTGHQVEGGLVLVVEPHRAVAAEVDQQGVLAAQVVPEADQLGEDARLGRLDRGREHDHPVEAAVVVALEDLAEGDRVAPSVEQAGEEGIGVLAHPDQQGHPTRAEAGLDGVRRGRRRLQPLGAPGQRALDAAAGQPRRQEQQREQRNAGPMGRVEAHRLAATLS